MAFRESLLNSWQRPTILTWLLWPLSIIYRVIFYLRGLAYKYGVIKSYSAKVPVIVVGNITVGGTGKTPMVIYLIELLLKHGFKPGVISRGYSGSSELFPLTVSLDTPASICGDEPALIVKHTNAPMVVGADRSATIEKLLREFEVNVIISDDGLQHLAMQRDVEICLEDLTTSADNQFLLPAGPYREPISRLQTVDLHVQHIDSVDLVANEPSYAMKLVADQPVSLIENNTDGWSSDNKIHAIAGIGNPQRFFNTCRALGMDIIEHVFPDHYEYTADDIEFNDDLPILMTEKDAVKCANFANQRQWYLPVNAKLSSNFDEHLLNLLKI